MSRFDLPPSLRSTRSMFDLPQGNDLPTPGFGLGSPSAPLRTSSGLEKTEILDIPGEEIIFEEKVGLDQRTIMNMFREIRDMIRVEMEKVEERNRERFTELRREIGHIRTNQSNLANMIERSRSTAESMRMEEFNRLQSKIDALATQEANDVAQQNVQLNSIAYNAAQSVENTQGIRADLVRMYPPTPYPTY